MFGFIGKYKKYIDELTAILDASSEIIFLCNNFDITRIHDLFINIIENYNYYEEGKNDTSQTERLGDEISKSAEYIKMKEYIDKNFENIKDKCECFTIKLEGFERQYLPDNAEIQDSSDDALIRDNFKSQYKTIRINLEDIQRELSKIKKITEPEITAIKDDDIQFNIFPITKSNMMYSSSFYSSFKMIFKNLQIIDSNENEITEQELDEINKDLKKLYINLIEKFNNDTINAQESVLKDIIEDLNKKGLSLKDKYESYIKKGGDVKGEVDEGEEGKGKGKVEGNGENVKNLEEEAERLNIQAEEAKKKADELASKAKLKEGKDDEEQLKDTEDALVAATAAHDAALKAHSAKKAVDKAKLAAAAAAEEDAKKKAEEANKKVEEAKKRAAAAAEEERKKEEAAEEERKKEEAAKKKKKDEEEAAEEERKKEEAAKKKKKDEEEAAKKKIEDEEEAAKKKKKDEEKTFVLNFEYNNNSCYIDSVLQMLIDNDELCVKIVNAAKDKTLETKFNKDALTEVEKTSDEYLLYLLNKIIQYHREQRHPIGDSKKPSYNDYILPLRNYLYGVNPGKFRQSAEEDVDDFLNFVLEKLSTLEISTEYDETKILLLKNDNNNESFEEIIKYQDSAIISNKENLIFKIGRSRNIRGADGNYLMENNKIKTEIVRKPITLSPKLVFGEGTTKTTYILKGFIHYDPGHYIYYKSLNNSGNEWVILDDRDTGTNPNSNEKHEVIGNPLGKNGNIISQENIDITGSTLFYYKKEKDDTTLNASQVGVELLANAGEDDPGLQAALAASLADKESVQSVQPVVVANATGKPFKYSFESVNDTVVNNNIKITPIYNSSDKPYYLDANKTPANFMASLNAGDEDLYVGGAFINEAFEDFLSNNDELKKLKKNFTLSTFSVRMHLSFYMEIFEITKEANKTDTVKYREYYLKEVIKKYNTNIKNYSGKLYEFKGGGLMDAEEFKNNPYYKESYLYISKQQLTSFLYKETLYPGDVFIDILKYPPLNYEVNKAMIYCVGPRGRENNKDGTEFLTAVGIVGKNIANAIFEYNKIPNKPNIDYARICLISGGNVFRNELKTPDDVAEALIKGIHSVNSDPTKTANYDIVYNFAYADNAFQTAFEKLKKTPEYTNDTTFVKLNIT